jgi:hypothetical protein
MTPNRRLSIRSLPRIPACCINGAVEFLYGRLIGALGNGLFAVANRAEHLVSGGLRPGARNVITVSEHGIGRYREAA